MAPPERRGTRPRRIDTNEGYVVLQPANPEESASDRAASPDAPASAPAGGAFVGDDGAKNAEITRLLIRHRGDLYGYIFACVRNHNDAEEVFQEVSVGVVTSFHKLRSTDEFLPWAIEISRRQVFSFFRRSKRAMVYDSELVEVLAEVAKGGAPSEESQRRATALKSCVEKLPPRSREVLRLRYREGFSGVDQIAEYLGRSMAATYGVLKRLRVNLRRCIERQALSEASR